MIDGEPVLEDGILVLLSQEINTVQELRKLATIGLRISDPTIAKNLYKQDDINETAYQVLLEWRKSQDNHKVAYVNLCKALRHKHVNLSSLIENVLEQFWNDLKATATLDV